MKKIMVYSHDAYGLGNIRRMLEIISQLVRTYPDITVLLITGSPMIHAFRISPRVDYIKLPCVARNETGDAVVMALALPYPDTIHLRSDVIMMATLDFDPDLIVVDKKPFGIADELEPVIASLRSRPRPPKAALLLRDILDEPAATIRQWQSGNYHEAIRQYYDLVLVAGEQEIFDVAREYCFPASTTDKLRYCGYIGRAAPAVPPSQMRTELGIDAAPLVLVTAGGGGDGSSLMMTYLNGLAACEETGFKTLLVIGPEMSPDSRRAIDALAAHRSDVIIREFSDDMMSAMNCADLVVSMCGYNTVCEFLTLKKKAVVVPRVTPVREQWIRAERLQARGLLRALYPDGLTPQSLMATVMDELFAGESDRLPRQELGMDGLPRISAALAELLRPGEQDPPPQRISRSAAQISREEKEDRPDWISGSCSLKRATWNPSQAEDSHESGEGSFSAAFAQ